MAVKEYCAGDSHGHMHQAERDCLGNLDRGASIFEAFKICVKSSLFWAPLY